MPISCNYPLQFSQNNLLAFTSDNKNIEKFTDKIITTSNIRRSVDGICLGLSHCFIAYENEGNGLAFIQNINHVINASKGELVDEKNLKGYSNLAYQKCAVNTLKKYYLNALKLHIDHRHSAYYQYMSKNILNSNLPHQYPHETNLEYINHCLFQNKNDELMDYCYELNSDVEKQMVKDLYVKIEKNIMICHPEISKLPLNIQEKIRNDQALTIGEVKTFLNYAYLYCAAHYEHKVNNFNMLAGITYNSHHPNDSYENTAPKWKTVTRYELKKAINIATATNKNFTAIYGTNTHAMAITAIYHPINHIYQFSFFDPDEGLICTTDKSKLMKFIDHIPRNPPSNIIKYANDREHEKLEPIGKILLLQTDKKNTRQLHLPMLTKKDIQIRTKKLLTQKKLSIFLKEGSPLTFSDYNPNNDELKLKLPLGKRIFTIYSELNDINQTVDLINNSMQEFPSYMGNDIYIDWKGQILNRLSKH